jgi:hypothetical protein
MIEKPAYLINVCASFRVKGEAKGMCQNKGSHDLLGYFEEGILDRGIDARVVSTGCMKQCEHGPIVVVMPEIGGTRKSTARTKWMPSWTLWKMARPARNICSAKNDAFQPMGLDSPKLPPCRKETRRGGF